MFRRGSQHEHNRFRYKRSKSARVYCSRIRIRHVLDEDNGAAAPPWHWQQHFLHCLRISRPSLPTTLAAFFLQLTSGRLLRPPANTFRPDRHLLSRECRCRHYRSQETAPPSNQAQATAASVYLQPLPAPKYPSDNDARSASRNAAGKRQSPKAPCFRARLPLVFDPSRSAAPGLQRMEPVASHQYAQPARGLRRMRNRHPYAHSATGSPTDVPGGNWVRPTR
jgi:hypothetical protein